MRSFVKGPSGHARRAVTGGQVSRRSIQSLMGVYGGYARRIVSGRSGLSRIAFR